MVEATNWAVEMVWLSMELVVEWVGDDEVLRLILCLEGQSNTYQRKQQSQSFRRHGCSALDQHFAVESS